MLKTANLHRPQTWTHGSSFSAWFSTCLPFYWASFPGYFGFLFTVIATICLLESEMLSVILDNLNYPVGTWAVYDNTSTCNTKSYIKCRLGGVSNWLLRNKWSFLCMFHVIFFSCQCWNSCFLLYISYYLAGCFNSYPGCRWWL